MARAEANATLGQIDLDLTGCHKVHGVRLAMPSSAK
jgi:hypothetical protein